MSEVLRANGYATASVGKWHLIPDPETTLAGPFDHWPTHQGFDYFYGFMESETDQWNPELVSGTAPVRMTPPAGREGDYTLNEDLATHARSWVLQQKGLAPDRPVFLYFAPGATHAPLQAPQKWIDRFKGQFDMGWGRVPAGCLRASEEARCDPGRHRADAEAEGTAPRGTRSRRIRRRSRRG